METLFYFIIFVALPLYLGWRIAKDRNRTEWKALLAVLFFGWLAVLGLALFLKTRDKKTGYLK